jgi:hypothetical protein
MKKLAIAAILSALLAGCWPKAEPYSEADAAEQTAICVYRIKTECKPLPDGTKDRACPAYVECRKYADEFEQKGQ